MTSFKWPSILATVALAAACGGQAPGQTDDSDTDDLSATTYSMEMVRANRALAPQVVVPDGKHTNGRARSLDSSTVIDNGGPQGFGFHGMVHEGDFLYAANQLGQFLQLADPAIHNDDKGDATYSRQPGDLFGDDGKLSWLDIEQGHLGDCYFASSIAAVLFADNGGSLTKNMIVPHKNTAGKVDSYTVTFFQASGRKVAIQVDPDLLHRNSSGGVLYMRSTETKPGYEEWSPSLVEKAYAKWHGSYNAVGNGGTAADAIWALSGKATRSYDPKSAATIKAIEAAGKASRAQVACTYGDHDGVKYPTGIYADHCYTLRGIHRVNGVAMVMLRNPWGPDATPNDPEPTEPPGVDGKQDGLFEITAAQFGTLYASVDIVP